ncbi:MAG: diacylglycerol kinase family protein [Myroides sp.]|uniref:Diacylglycerol kinase (ATP) n=2 Tax=Paenimyroides TaxID=3085669 RepID=A0A1I5FHR1_9FLAO|nr:MULTISPECIES: diacylglycerol kinase family protein [Paenimyroides]KAA5537801.1 diacylglycerol kinase family protein [Paenimyroides baculatum]SFO23338.1 diacylglycerol kinase (ATP) [Paenimyroides ummariense]
MKHQQTSFISGRIKSVTYAVKGFYLLITTEHSIMVQLTISALMCILGFYLKISAVEWMFQILAIGLVLTAESLNTAIEAICDYIQPNFDKKIGFIKDIAAGAVTFAALTAVVIGAIIYLPKLI